MGLAKAVPQASTPSTLGFLCPDTDAHRMPPIDMLGTSPAVPKWPCLFFWPAVGFPRNRGRPK